MGNLKTLCRTRIQKKYQELPLIESKDSEIIKTVWNTVIKDSTYYGFAMCTILFKNHPQYAKYFEDEALPDFVREAKVKEKFSTIYDIISVLFLNYNVKPAQRDYFLGYIAMIHKDMGLMIQDLQNFTSCIAEALYAELPHLMTSEYVIVQIKYFNIVSETLLLLMEKHRVKIDEMSHAGTKEDKIFGACFTRQSDLIYNYPLEYWLYKKRYWEYRRAVWASLEMGPAVGTAALTDIHKMRLQSRRKTLEIRRDNRRRSMVTNKQFSSDSDQNAEHRKVKSRKSVPGSWLLTNLRKKKKLKPKTAPKRIPIKTIYEVHHDKILEDMKRGEEDDSDIQQTYKPTLPMPANSQLPNKTPASSNQNNAARKRKRQRDNLISLVGDSYTM